MLVVAIALSEVGEADEKMPVIDVERADNSRR